MVLTLDEVYRQVAHESLLGFEKSRVLYNELVPTINLDGMTAEIGVYQGKTSKLIHLMMPHKTHYCYDTFCGIIGADSSIDLHHNGDFVCSLETVKGIINMPNVEYRVGYFPDSFKEHEIMFSFVHSDTDTYIGTKNTLEYFKDRMVKGGKILFDDYEWYGCPGVKKAISEFIEHDTLYEWRKPPTTQFVFTKK